MGSSLPRAIREAVGEEVEQHCNQYGNNRLEQDHRGIKQRYYPMRRFGCFTSAAHFCRPFDELRQFERYRWMRAEAGSLEKRWDAPPVPSPKQTARQQRMQVALEAIQARFGPNAVRRGSELEEYKIARRRLAVVCSLYKRLTPADLSFLLWHIKRRMV